MGTTTFSGPIRAGNIRNTTGTTVGTDIANVGYVVMTQQHVMDISGNAAITAQVTDIVIPANSKIVNIIVDLEKTTVYPDSLLWGFGPYTYLRVN